MKEQKELIEAALAFVEALEIVTRRGYIPRAEEQPLIQAAKAYCQAQEQLERRKAPWTDSEGNELFEGDELIDSNGTRATINHSRVYGTGCLDFTWEVRFGSGVTWPLRIFIDRNKAVKVSK